MFRKSALGVPAMGPIGCARFGATAVVVASIEQINGVAGIDVDGSWSQLSRTGLCLLFGLTLYRLKSFLARHLQGRYMNGVLFVLFLPATVRYRRGFPSPAAPRPVPPRSLPRADDAAASGRGEPVPSLQRARTSEWPHLTGGGCGRARTTLRGLPRRGGCSSAGSAVGSPSGRGASSAA